LARLRGSLSAKVASIELCIGSDNLDRSAGYLSSLAGSVVRHGEP
jgi:hypothetical protein